MVQPSLPHRRAGAEPYLPPNAPAPVPGPVFGPVCGRVSGPAVTVLVANHNGARFLAESLTSIRRQSVRDIEIIVVDDASTDGSRALVEAVAAQDDRVRLLTTAVQGGPAAARNLGLEQATGRWVAVVDSDDLLHPDRLARLLQQAEAHGSDIAADNLLVFDDAGTTPPYAFLANQTAVRQLDLAAYVLEDAYGKASCKLGYLKPLFRAEFIRQSGLRYRPSLRIAEDFSFVRELLAAGARYHIVPGLTYFYRKHTNSISHRLAPSDVQAMMADDAGFVARYGAGHPNLQKAFAVRRQGLQRALEFDTLVQAVKQRRWAQAAVTAIRHPGAGWMLRQAVAARLNKAAPVAEIATRPAVCLITRRPVTGDAEQVLASLIRLGGAFAAAGIDPHLIVPSATRAPQRVALARVPGMRAFKTVDMRSGHTTPPAPGDCWSTEEALFITRYARTLAETVVADWLPGIEAAPYTMRPDSLLLVLVDGLPPEARLPGFGSQWRQLAQADAILATRQEDAAVLRRACPGTPVMLLPDGQLVSAAPPAPRLAALLNRVWPGKSPPQRAGG